MKEATGDLWTYPADWRVITTNGTVKKNGECVMGRGCAKEAKTKYQELPGLLGSLIKTKGNEPFVFHNLKLITFPVKWEWMLKAEKHLIEQSARRLEAIVKELGMPSVVMPRPGCGNGGLKWEDVKPLIDFLPDNVTVITYD